VEGLVKVIESNIDSFKEYRKCFSEKIESPCSRDQLDDGEINEIESKIKVIGNIIGILKTKRDNVLYVGGLLCLRCFQPLELDNETEDSKIFKCVPCCRIEIYSKKTGRWRNGGKY